MLDPWIIEQIRRREEEERPHREERPVLEIPLDHPPDQEERPRDRRPGDRGVTILNYAF